MSRREQMKLALIIAALLVTAVTLTGAVAEKAACEAKGGKRLLGTWAWETFKCYDASTLKALP